MAKVKWMFFPFLYNMYIVTQMRLKFVSKGQTLAVCTLLKINKTAKKKTNINVMFYAIIKRKC